MNGAGRAGRRTRMLGAFLATGCLAVLTACGGDTDTEPLAYASYSAAGALGEGDGAALDGTLRGQGGCLVVELTDGTLVVPAFPADTTEFSIEDQVLSVGAARLEIGGDTSLGGGYLGAAIDDITIPPACDGAGEIFLVSTV